VKSARLRRTACLLGSLLACLVLASTACSNGGEGDRCEFDNGNDDCQDGLICIPASSRAGAPYVVNPAYANSDRCCPPNQRDATHPACVAAGGGGDAAGPDANNDVQGDAPNPPPPPPPPPPPDASDAADAADAADADGG
jgi:hypothetical protein